MAIKFIKPSSSQEKSDVIGELVNGAGKVPDWVDFDALAIRSDDPVVIEKIQALLGGEIEEHEGKKSHYVVFDEGQSLTIRSDFLRTSMMLKSATDYSTLRQCDGETMTGGQFDGKDCMCLRDYEHGTPEWRTAAKNNLACKPDALMFFTIPGLDIPGKFVFSKSSESTVRAFTDLEAKLPEDIPPFEVAVSLDKITSKKNDMSWHVPAFTDPVVTDG